MSTFNLSILAADCPFYEGPCESLVVPTSSGQYGILAHHSNMISAIIPGILTFRTEKGGEMQVASVSNGLVKIEDNDVLVLVDTAERPEEIDENRARLAADQAREEILQKRSIQEYRAAQAHLSRALARLRVKRNYGNK